MGEFHGEMLWIEQNAREQNIRMNDVVDLSGKGKLVFHDRGTPDTP